MDLYLDEMLDVPAFRDAADHVSACPSCETMVTRAQQVSSLLKTAVTDRVTAVGISGLWESVEPKLGLPLAGLHPQPHLGWMDRIAARWHSARPRRGGLTVRLGVLAASAAAVALVIASFWSDPRWVQVADNGARAKSRAVRIESLKVPSGYTIATWKSPRTRTQFISVSSGDGLGVSNINYGE